MMDRLRSVLALAASAPGSDDPENRKELEEGRRRILARPDLLAAAQAVLATWESGDLAAAVRQLQAAVDKTTGEVVAPSPAVRRFLDLSTVHLDPEAKEFLEGRGEGVTAYETDHGWLAYVSEPDMLADYGDVPPVLLAILARARSLGCEYVLLDADAPEDEILPTFDEHGAVA